MTPKNTAKSSMIIFLSMVFGAFATTIFANLILKPKNSLFFAFIDHLFFIDMVVLLIGCFMIIGQSGAYNSIAYSGNLLKARVSTKYKHELMASASIEEQDIGEYLKQAYLYRDTHYKHTYAVLIPSVLLFLGLMIYVTLIY